MVKTVENLKAAQLELTTRLVEIYGPSEGVKNCSVLVPAILKDFSGMLEKADVGDCVTETYRTEDGIAEIILRAVKKTGTPELSMDVHRRSLVISI